MFLCLFISLDQLLVPLALVVVALVAQRLQVAGVEEVFAHRPRHDMVHNGGRRHDTMAGALSAAREVRPGPQRRTEFRPAIGMV